MICDNRVNDDAEPDLLDSAGQIKFDFMDIIAPAFPDKSSKQDHMACLKRAHWAVNVKKALYLRPVGTVTGPVRKSGGPCVLVLRRRPIKDLIQKRQ